MPIEAFSFIVADDRLNAILQTDFITQLPDFLVFINRTMIFVTVRVNWVGIGNYVTVEAVRPFDMRGDNALICTTAYPLGEFIPIWWTSTGSVTSGPKL